MKNPSKTKTKVAAATLSAISLFSAVSVSMTALRAASPDNGVQEIEYDGEKIFYSDDYFRHSSTQYDPHLATLSVIATDKTVPLKNPKSAADKEWYENQPARIQGFFEEIGFTDFETNDDYKKASAFDTIGVAAANKKVDDYTVIAVTVRSGGYFREWANNVWLGDGSKSDNMHEGFYNAANKLLDFLSSYASDKNINGKVKVWLCGFSRGGATTNIAGGLLDNKIKNNEKIFECPATLSHDDLFVYTFEAPQGANYTSKTVEKPGSSLYNNIWNVVNPNDIVTKVPMSEFGFTRFGTDKYITTKFYDPDNYTANRKTFRHMYEMSGNNYSEYLGDTFTMYNIPFSKLVVTLLSPTMTAIAGNGMVIEKDTRKANYDANIASTLLLEEITKNIGSRKNYCNNYQSNMRDLMLCLMDDRVDVSEQNKSTLIKSVIACILSSAFGGATTQAFQSLEKILPQNTMTNATAGIRSLAGIVASVATERPNELISIAMQSDNIFDNHQFEVNIAHLMAQDSYYFTSEDKLVGHNIVPLRDNADFGRMSLKDFNEVGLFLETNGGFKNMIQVTGSKFSKSEIKRCNPGFAVGYYSYVTEEKMEIFMPANHRYLINFQSFSLKPYHKISYSAVYQCIGPNSKGAYKVDKGSYVKNDEFCDSDFLQTGANMSL